MRNVRDQLAVIFVFFILIESDCTKPRCPTVNRVDWFKNHCESSFSDTHLTCTGGFHGEWKNGSSSVRTLTLCGWSKRSFDPEDVVSKFPLLQNLSIFNSNLTHLTNPFPTHASHLQHIRLNGTRLNILPKNAFSLLPSLRILDLRHNDLSFVNFTAIRGNSLQRVHLSGNPWKCSIDMSWILDLNNDSLASRVVDRDKLFCPVKNRFDRPLVPMLEILQQVDIECPKNVCTCNLSHIHRNPGTDKLQLMVFVEVNCSSRNLTDMPNHLPNNTTMVHLSNNKIRDLSPLRKNNVYKNVKDVYLDNNMIDSIAILEGSDWLDQFRGLSLRGNLLTSLPTYALENVLQQNRNAASIFLGKNPWQCDCHFTPGFQILLSKHMNMFKDEREITCSKVENDENSGKPIMDLTRAAICKPPQDGFFIKPLDVLNVVLASLILFIFGKLLYDYWNFKKTGKLPWLVAKIP